MGFSLPEEKKKCGSAEVNSAQAPLTTKLWPMVFGKLCCNDEMNGCNIFVTLFRSGETTQHRAPMQIMKAGPAHHNARQTRCNQGTLDQA